MNASESEITETLVRSCSDLFKESENYAAEAICLGGNSYQSSPSFPSMMVTEEFDLLKWVKQVHDFAPELIKSKSRLFGEKVLRRNDSTNYVQTKLGSKFQALLGVDIEAIHRHYPLHTINPYVELLARCIAAHHLRLGYLPATGLTPLEYEEYLNRLNECVEDIRNQGKESNFRALVKKYLKSARKNWRSLRRYINRLFEVHGRLMVSRIDLSYLKPAMWPTTLEPADQYFKLVQHRDAFFKHIRETLPGRMVGFCWKMEYGLDRGHHCHVLLFFNGLQQDVLITRALGEHWQKVITSGRGTYWNCNAHKDSYPELGIGKIEYGDTELRRGLEKAAVYLTKIDFYIKFLTPDGARAFGRGNMPKLRDVKRGRPRIAKPHDKLSIATSV